MNDYSGMPLYRVIILSDNVLPLPELIYHINVAKYAYFNSVMHNGLIFWGNTSNSANIFEIRKNIIRIITGYRSRASCRDSFKTKNSASSVTIYTTTSLTCGQQKYNFCQP